MTGAKYSSGSMALPSLFATCATTTPPSTSPSLPPTIRVSMSELGSWDTRAALLCILGIAADSTTVMVALPLHGAYVVYDIYQQRDLSQLRPTSTALVATLRKCQLRHPRRRSVASAVTSVAAGPEVVVASVASYWQCDQQ